MKNRVLITSVGRKVGLVKAFQEAGWYVLGEDLNPSSIALNFCDEKFEEGKEVNLWIPTRDAEIKEAWEFNGWDTNYLDICLDKLKFHNFCKSNRFKTPEVYWVKPRIGAGNREGEILWQEFIGAEEISVDGYRDLRGNVISVIPRKRLKVISGESCVTSTIESSLIISQSVLMANLLHLVGHFVMQCFLVENIPVWLECNARLGGGSIVGIRAGCQSPSWMLKEINGKHITPCIGNYKVGLTGKSYTEWSFDEDGNNS